MFNNNNFLGVTAPYNLTPNNNNYIPKKPEAQNMQLLNSPFHHYESVDTPKQVKYTKSEMKNLNRLAFRIKRERWLLL